MRAETRPTPKPAKNRPATKRGIAVAAVCRITPNMKTKQEAIRPIRRPSRSPTGAEVREPKKVPAERRETICDCWEVEMALLPSTPVASPVEKVSSQYLMARIPPIVPVS